MNMKTMAIAIGFIIAFCAGIFFYAEWQKAKFDASLPEPPAPEVKAAETDGGHWHDGEWHAEPHNAVDTIASPQETAQDEVNLIPLDFTETVTENVTENVTEMQESPIYVLPPGISIEDTIRVNEAYKKWHRNVWQPAHDEWWQLAKKENWPPLMRLQGKEFLEHVEYVSSLSDAEYKKAVAEMEAHIEKQQAAWERLQDVERNQPDFVTEVLGGE